MSKNKRRTHARPKMPDRENRKSRQSVVRPNHSEAELQPFEVRQWPTWSVRVQRRQFYSIASILLTLLLVSLVATIQLDTSSVVLPTDYSFSETTLTRLPVTISSVESCGCWDGPRGQAERKFKYSISNRSSYSVNLSSGPGSNVRLIVAYPNSFTPIVTQPISSGQSLDCTSGTPHGYLASCDPDHAQINISYLPGTNRLFAVPGNYRVWALPSVPNNQMEILCQNTPTYPTVVGQSELLPGKSYSDDRIGYGDWVFYIPLPRTLAKQFGPCGPEIVPGPSTIDANLEVIGIAVIVPGAGLIGFAPVPSESLLQDPSTL